MSTVCTKPEAPDVLQNCVVCLERFKEPRMLVCGHYFCTKCLAGIYHRQRKRVLPCPMCRRVTTIPNGKNITDLPEPIRIEELKQQIDYIMSGDQGNTRPPCGDCKKDSRQVSHYCLDCENSMCAECTKDHDEKLLRHKTVPYAEVLFCATHPDYALSNFCGDCDQWLCTKCLASHSPKHSLENVQEMAALSRNALRLFIHCHNTTALDTSVVDQIKRKSEKTDTMLLNLHQTIGELREKLRTFEEKLTIIEEEIDAHFRIESQKILKYESAVRELYSSQRTMVEYAQFLMRNSSEAKLIEKAKEFSKALPVNSVSGTLTLKLPGEKTFSNTVSLLQEAMDDCCIHLKTITIKKNQGEESQAHKELGMLRNLDKEIERVWRQVQNSSNVLSRYITKAKYDQLKIERAHLCRSMYKTR